MCTPTMKKCVLHFCCGMVTFFPPCFSLVLLYRLDISVSQGREKLRELFYKNKHLTDIRVIDMLVIKVQTVKQHWLPTSALLVTETFLCVCVCCCIFRVEWNWRKRSRAGNRILTLCVILTNPCNLVPQTSCPNSTAVMTHELCGSSFVMSSLTDVSLCCKYTPNTHTFNVVSGYLL